MATTETAKVFIKDSSISWEDMGNGVKRKIMAWDDKLMIVKVAFEKGGVGSLHEHHHTQITHIEAGLFEVEIGGEKEVLKAGDGFYVPPNTLHGAVCLEAGILIDCFSPMREDFVGK